MLLLHLHYLVDFMSPPASEKKIDIGATDAQVAPGADPRSLIVTPSNTETPPSPRQSLDNDKPSLATYSPTLGKDDHDYDCTTPSTLVGWKETPKEYPESFHLPPVLETRPPPQRPYSAFSNKMKWIIALLCGAGAIISPLSSNIFVPAIPSMAAAFGHSEEHIALGVSVYLVFQ